ncbi:MAG: ribose-phosphate diphosphokinase [Fibrobacteres bacterium]|nr:ribose-phosphate diphosphokinase [Fibrobacterota bacterium]
MQEMKARIFAGSSGKEFALKICDYLKVELGRTEVITFSEGNTYVKIGEHVRGKEVYIIQPIGLNANNEFVELLFWLDAFKRSGASYVTVVMPYFSYAKGDKKDEPRVSIRARVCAECIELAGADRIITMDLHAAQIQGFFKKPVDHLYSRPILAEYIKTLSLENAVIVAPDAGFTKNARKFGGYLGLPTAIGDKTRSGHNEKAEILEIIGEVKGKNAIIVDDFSISGGTLVDLASTLKKRGALKVYACLSHLPLSSKGIEAIEKSDIEKVIATDSIQNVKALTSNKISIISVAPLFAEIIKRMENRQSISDLFDGITDEILKTSF